MPLIFVSTKPDYYYKQIKQYVNNSKYRTGNKTLHSMNDNTADVTSNIRK